MAYDSDISNYVKIVTDAGSILYEVPSFPPYAVEQKIKYTTKDIAGVTTTKQYRITKISHEIDNKLNEDETVSYEKHTLILNAFLIIN